MRPLLKPALRRLWRDPQTLQLGVGPQRAMVVAGVDVGDVGILHLLDGRRELDDLVGEAARLGHQPERVRRLVEVLSSAAAIDDAAAGEPDTVAGNPRLEPDLLSLSLVHPEPGAAAAVVAARGRAAVEVVGGGRVGASVLALLAAAGVGRVSVVDDRP
ncbi:MAG TPA: hypothetical protein VG708_06430, partial [Mycobacteriales bacterium]|nr:hypothetical protein [Mycobacteriales bacterium]